MSLGLRLLAKLAIPAYEPAQFMERIEHWVRNKFPDVLLLARHATVDTYPTLFCLLHPAAEEVELTLLNSEHLVVSANTSTVGPGYHVFLTSMLQNWARDFHASWDQPQESSEDYGDEADYFFSTDEKQLFDNMTSWLQAVANTFFNGSLEPDDQAIALGMPMDPQFEMVAPAITPLGPRNRDWLYETAHDGWKGKDFFAWWTPGLNAEYHLGRALTHMWSNVRWRPPVAGAEENVLKDVIGSLRRAYRLDPSLPYPWAEWQEILALLGPDIAENEFVRSQVSGKGTIGYRRRNVVVGLPGGWRIRLPGSFSDFQADEDSNLCAVDPPKEIWFTSYRFTSPSPAATFDSMKAKMKQDNPDYFIERQGYIGKAAVTKKRRNSAEDYFVLNSSNACPSQRAICTIVFSRDEERDWALEVWRSLQPPAKSEI